jgi:catechol 2,3-dioxygenase-like lactoylglutathione lyase family enzyme
MLDHIGIAVRDYARSKRFYETALAPLTITLVMEVTAEQTDGGSAAAGSAPSLSRELLRRLRARPGRP